MQQPGLGSSHCGLGSKQQEMQIMFPDSIYTGHGLDDYWILDRLIAWCHPFYKKQSLKVQTRHKESSSLLLLCPSLSRQN